MESDHIRTDAVSAVEYPELVRHYRITGVPKTVIDDTADILGAVPEAQFVQAVIDAGGTAAEPAGPTD